jgi:acyl carrier protein
VQISREELQALLAEAFEAEEEPAAFTLAVGPDDIGTWNSFNHLNLVVTLEDRCGVSFSTDEIASMLSVGEIVARLREHGVDIDWPE